MDLTEYNEHQIEAITYEHFYKGELSHLMIVAGAGTGKTKVLTGRMAWLIEEKQINPREIMGITFSTMAANQMKDRLALTIPRQSLVWIRTIHSMCLMILREFAPPEWKPSGIVSGKVKIEYISDALKTCGFTENQFPVEEILKFIDEIKTSEEPEQKLKYSDKERVLIYQAYTARLDFLKLVDFPDLIHRTRMLFDQVPDVLRDVQQNIKYILVDEFQDLDAAQYALIHKLAGQTIPMTVVGDDDQTIYNFRGSQPDIFNRFEREHSPAIVKMEVCYRCTETILKGAQQMIANNKSRFTEKALRSARTGDGVITVKGFRFPEEEVHWIVSEITQSVVTVSPSQIAVLARTKGILDAVRRSLIEKKIPVYRPPVDFYQTKEFGDLFAWLQLISLPTLDNAFERAMMVPQMGLGESTVGLLRDIAEKRNIPLIQAAEDAVIENLLRDERKAVMEEFIRRLLRMQEVEKANPSRPAYVINALLKEIDYDGYLHSQYGLEDCQKKKQTVKMLVDMGRSYEEQYGQDATLLNFIHELALETLVPTALNHQGVMLLTFHAAKGLEFEQVFLAGIERGIIPHKMSIADPSKVKMIDEERRLMYVAVTRAVSKLVMTWVEYRERGRGMQSMFIQEMGMKWTSKLQAPNHSGSPVSAGR